MDSSSMPLTLAVCSNRPEQLRKHWRSNLAGLGARDKFLVVLDTEGTPATLEVAEELQASGVAVIINYKNRGLALSRNIALENCSTPSLVFIDDDVLISGDVVEAMRGAFVGGAGIVGVKVYGPPQGFRTPWYLCKGQFHYLAIHNPEASRLTTWGACMGLSTSLIKSFDVKFRPTLGRKGDTLMCGEDTTFLRELKSHGATETFLSHLGVNHIFDPGRLSLGYLLQRAYWQGRTEARRGNTLEGLRKEWLRYLDTSAPPLKKISLALMYGAVVGVGIVAEKMSGRAPVSCGGEPHSQRGQDGGPSSTAARPAKMPETRTMPLGK